MAYPNHMAAAVADIASWLWLGQGIRLDRRSLPGGAVCILGAGIILLAPRGA